MGELVDALVDPNQDFAIRRRLPRVSRVCASQRAVDGLLLGLDDTRFEVRYQCARSLAAVLQRNPRVRIGPQFVFEVVEREVAVGRPVWESNRLLHRLDSQDENFFVDEFVKDRAGRSLAHVFTLLSLVFPAESPPDRLPRPALARTATCEGQPSSIWRASCPRISASACGRFSRIPPRRPPDAAARRNPGGPAALQRVHHAEPRRVEATRLPGSDKAP